MARRCPGHPRLTLGPGASMPATSESHSASLFPQSPACDFRSFAQGLELCPGHIRMDLVAGPGRRKTAIRSSDDSLSPDDACETLNTVRHQLRMLNLIDTVR